MRKLFAIVFSLVFALSSVLTALAVPSNPQDFVDVMNQKTVVPGASRPEWPEHYIYDDLYVDAMWPGSHYFTWYAPSSLLTEASNAMSLWNGSRPTSVDGAVFTNNQAAANVEFIEGPCPGSLGAPACTDYTNWTTVGGFNVNLWLKAKVYVNATGGVHFPGYSEWFYWSAGARQAAMLHEIGHLWGLGEQYTSSGACNSSSFSIMDGLRSELFEGAYYMSHCDTTSIQTVDFTKRTWYFIGGGYKHYNYINAPTGITSNWLDESYMDWVTKVYYHWGNGPSGPWYNFTYDAYTIVSNGSAKWVPTTPSQILLASTINPSNWNIHQKYILACSQPIVNNDQTPIEYRCATYAVWWP